MIRRPRSRLSSHDEQHVWYGDADLVGNLLGKKSFIDVLMKQTFGGIPDPVERRIVLARSRVSLRTIVPSACRRQASAITCTALTAARSRQRNGGYRPILVPGERLSPLWKPSNVFPSLHP